MSSTLLQKYIVLLLFAYMHKIIILLLCKIITDFA
nr:MAG TPA: hypothetical protein [Caudoviricetes sp.]